MRTTAIKTLSKNALRVHRPRRATTSTPNSLCFGRGGVPSTPRLVSNRGLVVVAQHKANETVVPLARPSSLVESNALTSLNQKQSESLSSTEAVGIADLVVTPSCFARIQTLAKRRNLPLETVYLRVYVDAGGCSGFSYKFELDESPLDEGEDLVFVDPTGTAARLVIDASSLAFMRGSTIDFVEEMIKSSFEVKNNPQSESACGCGSSFAIKNFSANPAVD